VRNALRDKKVKSTLKRGHNVGLARGKISPSSNWTGGLVWGCSGWFWGFGSRLGEKKMDAGGGDQVVVAPIPEGGVNDP